MRIVTDNRGVTRPGQRPYPLPPTQAPAPIPRAPSPGPAAPVIPAGGRFPIACEVQGMIPFALPNGEIVCTTPGTLSPEGARWKDRAAYASIAAALGWGLWLLGKIRG